MSWELATILTVYSVPLTTIYMANKQLTNEASEHFWWIKLLIFFFNLFFIGLGLWITQRIAVAQDATVGQLLEVAWQSYTYLMLFVILIIVIILGVRGIKVMFEKFPSLKEKR